MTRAVIYARVSSQAQRDAHTIESQLHVLRLFVAGQGWTLVGEYLDDGRSAKTGKLERRDGFARLLADVERGGIDVLVIVDVDRLTRTDSIEERARILGPFQRAGIRIVSPSSGEIDLRTMFGQLDATLRSLYAAEENRKRAERIKAGKARAIAEGRKPAGPTPFGWSYDRAAGRWSIHDPAAAIMREIFRRVAGGESCVVIAEDLIARAAAPAPRTGWTRAAVYRIVRKRTAVGEWDADKAKGATIRIPPIVTEREWQAAARALLSHKRRGLRRTRHLYLLEAIATCACGEPMLIRSASPGRRGYVNPPAYVCRGRRLRRSCSEPVARCAELDAGVWAALCDEIAQPELMDALAGAEMTTAEDAQTWAKDADGYRAHLARLERVESTIMARFRRGIVSEGALDAELAAIARERTAVRAQLATADNALWSMRDAGARLEAASEVVSALRESLPYATPEQRRALLRELVKRCVVKDGIARVTFRLQRSAAVASADPSVVSAEQAGSRTQHETTGSAHLTIRRVAPPIRRTG